MTFDEYKTENENIYPILKDTVSPQDVFRRYEQYNKFYTKLESIVSKGHDLFDNELCGLTTSFTFNEIDDLVSTIDEIVNAEKTFCELIVKLTKPIHQKTWFHEVIDDFETLDEFTRLHKFNAMVRDDLLSFENLNLMASVKVCC